MVADSRDHGQEIVGLAKCTALNRLEDLGQVRIDCVRAVRVRMAEILDILSEVAEEEDVVLANLTGDLNLRQCQLLCYCQDRRHLSTYVCTVTRADDQTAI